jgi:hypothetical protein
VHISWNMNYKNTNLIYSDNLVSIFYNIEPILPQFKSLKCKWHADYAFVFMSCISSQGRKATVRWFFMNIIYIRQSRVLVTSSSKSADVMVTGCAMVTGAGNLCVLFNDFIELWSYTSKYYTYRSAYICFIIHESFADKFPHSISISMIYFHRCILHDFVIHEICRLMVTGSSNN